MKRFVASSRFCLLLVLASLALTLVSLTGCSTTESENLSARPWNSPEGWENGALPSSLNEGH